MHRRWPKEPEASVPRRILRSLRSEKAMTHQETAEIIKTQVLVYMEEFVRPVIRELVAMQIKGHLETIIESAKDEATRAIALKLLTLAIKETMTGGAKK